MSIPVRAIYYDGACPLCAHEMARYAALRGASAIRFVDIAAPAFDAGAEGLAGRDYMTCLHARRADGALLVGVDAFLGIWGTLPALAPLARIARFPPLKALLVFAYALFAPIRPRLPFRRACAPDAACRVAPAHASSTEPPPPRTVGRRPVPLKGTSPMLNLLVFSAVLGFAAKAHALVPNASGVFEQAALPYAHDALEPAIDKQTMEIHHGKHHKAYVDNLNKQVEANPELKGKPLAEILANVSKFPAAVRNNGGGHWNHAFFWSLMGPVATSGAPSPELAKALDASFGSFDKFKEEFEKAGVGRFGSGWAWLLLTAEGKLAVSSTPNQDNPLMDVAETKGVPILGNDVWEHAYYLKYQNRRADYMKAWWTVVNWEKVSALYAEAVKGR